MTVATAIDQWLDICEKEGRYGRDPVTKYTHKNYRHRGEIMKSYAWRRYRPMLYLAADSGMRPQEYLVVSKSGLRDGGIEVARAIERPGRKQAVRQRCCTRAAFLGKTNAYRQKWLVNIPQVIIDCNLLVLKRNLSALQHLYRTAWVGSCLFPKHRQGDVLSI